MTGIQACETMWQRPASSTGFAWSKMAQDDSLGDSKSVGEGVIELRVHVGAGYRVYCGRYGSSFVILLCGGDKSSQSKDIELAKAFWADWKRRQK